MTYFPKHLILAALAFYGHFRAPLWRPWGPPRQRGFCALRQSA
jgi:hypothetical protein